MTGRLTATSRAGPSLLAAKRLAILGVAAGVGLVAIILFTLGVDDGPSVLASAIMFSLAAMLAGGFLGFLFGIPRALTSSGAIAGGEAPAAAAGRYAANTNLEQVSDWLTKLLLGATLVQLGAIRKGGGQLFATLAPALGDRSDSTAFGGALLIYYSLVGFLIGWLATRLFLAPALNALDEQVVAKLAEAEEAEESGDKGRASELRREAVNIITAAAPVAERYLELRNKQKGSAARTDAMEDVVANARRMAPAMPVHPDAVRALFWDGDDGQRVSALGLMQGRIDLADVGAVIEAIANSHSAFEQFHGLKLAMALATADGALDDGNRARLLDAVRQALEGPRQHLLDQERRELAGRIIAKLAPS